MPPAFRGREQQKHAALVVGFNAGCHLKTSVWRFKYMLGGSLKPQRSVHMKKFILGSIFLFVSMFVFGQIPGAVIHEFESRARDIHEDDLFTVVIMFADFLAAGGLVNVVDDTVSADYSIHGLITQLGTSITFSITLRDTLTASVLSSVQRQYTVENIWDNSEGIPGQLSDMASAVANAINTEHNRRQREVQEQIAMQEEERRAELARQEAIRRAEELRQMLFGAWRSGIRGQGTNNAHAAAFGPGSGAIVDLWDWQITFNNDGTFIASRQTIDQTQQHGNNMTHNARGERIGTTDGHMSDVTNHSVRGSFTHSGNSLLLNWNQTVTVTTTDSRRRITENNRRQLVTAQSPIGRSVRNNPSSSGNVRFNITLGNDINGQFLTLQRVDGNNFFPNNSMNFRKQ